MTWKINIENEDDDLEFIDNKNVNEEKIYKQEEQMGSKKLWDKCCELLAEERANNWIRSADPDTISTITSHAAGYIDKDLEVIVWLQTDEPLKRAIKPYWWVRVVEKSLEERWYHLSERVKDIFKYTKNHNDSVFSVYDKECRTYRL